MLINELSSKGELYDALHARATRMESDLSEARQKDLVQTLTLKSLQEDRESQSSRLFNLEKSQDLLRQDKMYLTKEVERLTECYRNSERSVERSEVKNVELKRQKEELVDKLVKVREEHQQSYEEKLNVTQTAHIHIHAHWSTTREVKGEQLGEPAQEIDDDRFALFCYVVVCCFIGRVESLAESYGF